VKVGGERLYKKARRGEAVEGEPRPVTVHRAELLWHEGDRAEFELEVSSGTYVRSLIADLGDAYCEELRRTAVGPFSVADAGSEVPLADALAFLPSFSLDGEQARVVSHGVAVPGQASTEAVRMVFDGRLVAIGRPENDAIKPFIVFNE
jgi:tRNA pseudouridine55 synthase